MQGVPDGWLSAKGYLPGNPVGIEKMEYADPELAVGDEPIY